MGIHGIHRARAWDVVTTVGAGGDGVRSVAVVLPDATVVREDGDAGAPLEALAAAVTLEPPFRLEAVRRDGDRWSVGASRIDIVRLDDDPGGETLELTWDGVERALRVDGSPRLASVPELEALGVARHARWAVLADRVSGPWWEVVVAPL